MNRQLFLVGRQSWGLLRSRTVFKVLDRVLRCGQYLHLMFARWWISVAWVYYIFCYHREASFRKIFRFQFSSIRIAKWFFLCSFVHTVSHLNEKHLNERMKELDKKFNENPSMSTETKIGFGIGSSLFLLLGIFVICKYILPLCKKNRASRVNNREVGSLV